MLTLIAHLKLLWYGLLVLLATAFITLCIANSETLAAIRIKLLDGQTDRMDRKLPLIMSAGEELPDYRAEILIQDHWHEVGTIPNSSARDWLSYHLSDQPNALLVQRLRIVEDDKLSDDLVDEVSVVGDTAQGTVFTYAFEHSASFKAGMDWFAGTALGKTIFTAIGIAVLLAVLAHLPIG